MRVDPFSFILSCFLIAATFSLAVAFIDFSGGSISPERVEEAGDAALLEQLVEDHPTAFVLSAFSAMLFVFHFWIHAY